jgi:hypothetical protein
MKARVHAERDLPGLKGGKIIQFRRRMGAGDFAVGPKGEEIAKRRRVPRGPAAVLRPYKLHVEQQQESARAEDKRG